MHATIALSIVRVKGAYSFIINADVKNSRKENSQMHNLHTRDPTFDVVNSHSDHLQQAMYLQQVLQDISPSLKKPGQRKLSLVEEIHTTVNYFFMCL